MEIFTGIDVIELKRFYDLTNFERVAELVLSPKEIQLMLKSRDKHQFLASRFALKEAVIKALPQNANMSDLEVMGVNSRPEVLLTNPLFKSYSVAASLSHSESIVAATAVVFKN